MIIITTPTCSYFPSFCLSVCLSFIHHLLATNQPTSSCLAWLCLVVHSNFTERIYSVLYVWWLMMVVMKMMMKTEKRRKNKGKRRKKEKKCIIIYTIHNQLDNERCWLMFFWNHIYRVFVLLIIIIIVVRLERFFKNGF